MNTVYNLFFSKKNKTTAATTTTTSTVNTADSADSANSHVVNDANTLELKDFFSTQFSDKKIVPIQEYKYNIRAHGCTITNLDDKYYAFILPKNVEIYTYEQIGGELTCNVFSHKTEQCNLRKQRAYLYKDIFPDVLLTPHETYDVCKIFYCSEDTENTEIYDIHGSPSVDFYKTEIQSTEKNVPETGTIFLSHAIKKISEHSEQIGNNKKIKVYLEACLVGESKIRKMNYRNVLIEEIEEKKSKQNNALPKKEEKKIFRTVEQRKQALQEKLLEQGKLLEQKKLLEQEKLLEQGKLLEQENPIAKKPIAIRKEERKARNREKKKEEVISGGALSDDELLIKLEYENSYINDVLENHETHETKTINEFVVTFIYTIDDLKNINYSIWKNKFIFYTKSEISEISVLNKSVLKPTYNVSDILSIATEVKTNLNMLIEQNDNDYLYKTLYIILQAFAYVLKAKNIDINNIFKSYVDIDLTKSNITEHSLDLIIPLLKQLKNGFKYKSILFQDNVSAEILDEYERNRRNNRTEEERKEVAAAIENTTRVNKKVSKAMKDAMKEAMKEALSAGGYSKKYITLTNKKHKKHKKKHTKHKKKYRKNRKTQKN